MITERKAVLLRELVKKRAPDSCGLAEAFISGGSLTDLQVEFLVNLINEEFMAKGINADFEPNTLGHELEALLDDVNRSRFRR